MEIIHGTMWGRENDGPSKEFSPWQELAAAIVKKAADDYIKVLRRMWRKSSKPSDVKKKRDLIVEKIELEEFFHSGWFEALSDINPDMLIYQCRVKARELEKTAIECANRKRIRQMMKEV